jgi:cyclic pyranopterin phosphate synthase
MPVSSVPARSGGGRFARGRRGGGVGVLVSVATSSGGSKPASGARPSSTASSATCGKACSFAASFAAKEQGFPIKINAVIEKGVNDDEIIDLVEFSREHGFAVRFIEYMDVGNANHWKSDRLVSKQEILALIGRHYSLREVGRADGSAPAVDYRFEDRNLDVGVIASVTEPFCGTCTRARLTADGKLVTCLFSNESHDLKQPLRGGASDEEIARQIEDVWHGRKDRYSEERLVALNSIDGYRPEQHKKIEMIRLGG